jgi:DNA polymerase-3 subunit alpha
MKRVAKLGMPAVAMTDHGNLFGAIEFYQKARDYEIKPIIGCEVYVAPTDKGLRKEVPGHKRNYHLTLLARNETGYRNLVKLVSRAHLEGFYYRPRTDKADMARFSDGLICLSGCISSEVNHFIRRDQHDQARAAMEELVAIYGSDQVYVEIHDHGLQPQQEVRPHLLQFAQDLGLKTVAANDVHFLKKSDHEAHDVMVCIGTNHNVLDENRMRYPEEVYLKSPREMRKLFKSIPGACDTTLEIAERCGFEIELDATSISRYPVYTPEPADGARKDEDRNCFFRRLCDEGMINRYGQKSGLSDPRLRERLDTEIALMEDKGFVSYFLIVKEFMDWAREQKIPLGPGRGSAAGSIVAYALGITDICPMRFELFFERFLNPERISPPDIDIDFCQTRRPEVIEHVRHRYGERRVAHIITFGKMLAKGSIRDVGRVLGLGYSDGDRIAKMIPNELGITLAEARKKNPELREALQNEEQTANVWRFATFMEGLKRNAGVHAAGVVIGNCDLDEYCPLTTDSEGMVVTQYDMGPLTDLGMLKMDFLGLKTLTVIQDAVDLIRLQEPDFQIEDSDSFDDQPTFDLLGAGETIGVFQMESGGMMNLCRQMKVDRIEDIIALIALYRPGPMDLIPDYVARKHGKQKVRYIHPLMEDASKETYGILIYQEQVMKAANLLAGFSLGDGDVLRRAMGKKKLSEMVEQREKFVKGCADVNRIDAKKANEIFDLLEKFAGYGFNKSHSAAYGVVAWRTAFLKANHPVEFMAAVLSNEITNTDKISFFVSECRHMGITVLPPDINRSLLKFAPESDFQAPQQPVSPAPRKGHPDLHVRSRGKAIRFGLSAIKNVGLAAMEMVISERDANGIFSSMEDFANRLEGKVINKKILESLVKAGAFDFLGEPRAALFARIEHVIASASSAQRDRAAGQESLFDAMALISTAPSATIADNEATTGGEARSEWPVAELLAMEKDLLGFYVSGHPLDDYRPVIEQKRYSRLAMLEEMPESRKSLAFAGYISSLEVKYTKKTGSPFAIFTLEDFTGSAEVIAWSDVYQQHSQCITGNAVVALKARVEIDSRSETRRLSVDKIRTVLLDEARDIAAGDHEAGMPSAADRTAPGAMNGVASDALEVEPDRPPIRIDEEPSSGANDDDHSRSSQRGESTGREAAPVSLHLTSGVHLREDLEQIRDITARHPGSHPLRLVIATQSGKIATLVADASHAVEMSDELATSLSPWMQA